MRDFGALSQCESELAVGGWRAAFAFCQDSQDRDKAAEERKLVTFSALKSDDAYAGREQCACSVTRHAWCQMGEKARFKSWGKLFCLQLELACLQLSFLAYSLSNVLRHTLPL